MSSFRQTDFGDFSEMPREETHDVRRYRLNLGMGALYGGFPRLFFGDVLGDWSYSSIFTQRTETP